MEGMEDKLNSILGNPEMMSQLMTMAQSLGQQQSAPPSPQPQESSFSLPAGLDMQTLQKIASIAAQSGIDNHQQSLLSALTPYLHGERIQKLEKAMRAAKIANLATTFFSGGIPFLQLGR